MAETLESGPLILATNVNSLPLVSVSDLQDDGRVQIDTSAPFESVREAATLFGGFGFWRPSHLRIPEVHKDDVEEADIAKLEEEAAELEKDLIGKERETLEVLKELEATKTTVEELKLKLLRKEDSEVSKVNDLSKEADKENHGHGQPGAILIELNQAKMILSRTTNYLADIRMSVELLNKKLVKERTSLEKTRERLSQNSFEVSSLEKELSDTERKLEFAKEIEISDGCSDNPSEIAKELQRLCCEAEKFKKMGENARSVVFRAMSEIERTKNKIKTAEIRLVAARKMKEAARAAEAVALAEIRAVTKRKNPGQTADAVTVSIEEYNSLTQKAKEATEKANEGAEDAMSKVDEANVSKKEILKKVGEASEEIKTGKRALEEALEIVEAANNAKLKVEEALRKWRSESGQRRRSSSVNNRAKFKNSPQYRRESRLLDVNGLNLMNNDYSSLPVLRPTMSIGQILSRKLLLADESQMNFLGEKKMARPKVSVSLGQMLGNTNIGDVSVKKKKKKTGKENGKQFTGKRKKFGFAKFSVLLNKESKKMKNIALNLR